MSPRAVFILGLTEALGLIETTSIIESNMLNHMTMLALLHVFGPFPKRRDQPCYPGGDRGLLCKLCGTVENEHLMAGLRIGIVNHAIIGTVYFEYELCETCRARLFGFMACKFSGQGSETSHFLELPAEEILALSEDVIYYISEDLTLAGKITKALPGSFLENGKDILYAVRGANTKDTFFVRVGEKSMNKPTTNPILR